MQWPCVQLSGESAGLLEKEVVLATSATPCAKVARGQTGLQKAEGQPTYHHLGTKPANHRVVLFVHCFGRCDPKLVLPTGNTTTCSGIRH